jgi:hypothetical protein
MSEELEQNEGTWSGLKKTIIGVATTAIMGLGTWGITKVTGGGDESSPASAAPAPVINITTNNTQQQQAAGGTKVIERVVEKPATKPAEPAKPKKEFTEEPKW